MLERFLFVSYMFWYSELVLFVFTDPVARLGPGPRPTVGRMDASGGVTDGQTDRTHTRTPARTDGHTDGRTDVWIGSDGRTDGPPLTTNIFSNMVARTIW
jgi:hypothetical protein